jgi:hypothetical protein
VLSLSPWPPSDLRTQLNRIIAKAGLKPWPKLFHNLRSTRQTELAEKFPAHVVCEWIGDSQTVAAKHYLQTTDEHFELAAAVPTGALQSPVQQPAGTERNEAQERTRDAANSPDCATMRFLTPVNVGDAGLEPATSAL